MYLVMLTDDATGSPLEFGQFVFEFKDIKGMMDFVKICLDNGYEVAIKHQDND